VNVSLLRSMLQRRVRLPLALAHMLLAKKPRGNWHPTRISTSSDPLSNYSVRLLSVVTLTQLLVGFSPSWSLVIYSSLHSCSEGQVLCHNGVPLCS
jgi:hypothetical protein